MIDRPVARLIKKKEKRHKYELSRIKGELNTDFLDNEIRSE